MLVAIPLTLEFIIAAILGGLVNVEQQAAMKIDRYRTIIASTNDLVSTFYGGGQALLLFNTLHDANFLSRYDESAARVSDVVSRLLQLTENNPAQLAAMKKLAVRANDSLQEMDAVKRLLLGDQKKDLRSMLDQSNVTANVSDTLNGFIAEMHSFTHVVKETDKTSPAAAEQLRALLYIFVFAAAVISAAFIALSLYFYGNLTGRLHLLMDNIASLGRNETLQARVSGDDEIARVDGVLHDAARALIEAAEQRQQLIGVVSHELRSPLSSVHAFLNMLSAGVYGVLSDELKGRTVGAEVSTARLIRLINDLLDVEKASELEMQVSKVDAVVVFEKSTDAVEAFAEHHGVRLRSQLLDVQILGDEDRLVQVVVNLLTNAIKFSPEGSSTVSLTGEQVDGMLEIRIADNGPGIPQNERNCVFERFYQSKSAEEIRDKGSGLGLAITKAIVTQHGGKIGVRDNEPSGSIFWVQVPLA